MRCNALYTHLGRGGGLGGRPTELDGGRESLEWHSHSWLCTPKG